MSAIGCPVARLVSGALVSAGGGPASQLLRLALGLLCPVIASMSWVLCVVVSYSPPSRVPMSGLTETHWVGGLVAHDVDHFTLIILDDDPPCDAAVDDHFDCRLVVLRARLVPCLFDELANRFVLCFNPSPLIHPLLVLLAAVVVVFGVVGLFLFLIRDLRSICLASLTLLLNPARALLPLLLSP